MDAQLAAHAEAARTRHVPFDLPAIVGRQGHAVYRGGDARVAKHQHQVCSHSVQFLGVAANPRVGHEVEAAKGEPRDPRHPGELRRGEVPGHAFDQRKEHLALTQRSRQRSIRLFSR